MSSFVSFLVKLTQRLWACIYDSIFLEPADVRKNKEVLEYWKEQDHHTQKWFISVAFTLKMLQFAVGITSLPQILLFIGVITPFFVMFYQEKTFLVKIYFFFLNCILPNFMHEKYSANLLTFGLHIIIFPTYHLIISRSSVMGILIYSMSSVTLWMRIKPMLLDRLVSLNYATAEKLVNTMNGFCMETGLIILIAMILQLRNREKVILKFFEQKKELEEMNAKLVSANNELNNNIKHKDEFLLGISHELRNPLNIILGNLEIVIENPKSLNIMTYLSNCKISGELLTFLINNLLDAGKLQNQNLEIAPVPTNIYHFIERMWATTKILIQRRNLQGAVFIEKSLPETLVVDPNRLMQIFFNLISNSAKFTKSGGIIICISHSSSPKYNDEILEVNWQRNDLFKAALRQNHSEPTKPTSRTSPQRTSLKKILETSFDEIPAYIPDRKALDSSVVKTMSYVDLSRRYYKLDYNKATISRIFEKQHQNFPNNISLKIEVIDTGCGMNDEDLQNLFKKFSQFGAATQRQIGSGLGLWITQSLCVNMQGGIKAYSKEGHGSTFAVAIPCTVLKKVVKTSGRALTALVVDDNLPNRQLHQYFLEKSDVHVKSLVTNGAEAVQVYTESENGAFDIIFMDLNMPIMNGEEACTKIRAHEGEHNWRASTICIITGNCDKENYRKYLNPKGKIRADYIFSKPFTLDQCQDLLQQIIKKSSNTTIEDSTIPADEKIVLIVDDDDFNCKLLEGIFEGQGVKTITAYDGQDAVNKYIQFHQHIDIIFMDCQMPTMDGLIATTIIKNMIRAKNWRQIKIIGLTGMGGTAAKQDCFNSGMDDVMVKPLKLADLIFKVKNL
jgi:signal transduction histidine kinase/DNA-binding response OmpR family regulator